MPIFNRFVDGLLFKGGILVTGIVCLYLSKNDFLPRYMNPVSYGLSSLGALGVLIGLTAEEEVIDDEDDDPTYEERMAQFRRVKPSLEVHISDQVTMMQEYERAKGRWNYIDQLERDSLRFERILKAYEDKQKELADQQKEGTQGEASGRCSKSQATFYKRHGKRFSLSDEDMAQLTQFYMAF